MHCTAMPWAGRGGAGGCGCQPPYCCHRRTAYALRRGRPPPRPHTAHTPPRHRQPRPAQPSAAPPRARRGNPLGWARCGAVRGDGGVKSSRTTRKNRACRGHMPTQRTTAVLLDVCSSSRVSTVLLSLLPSSHAARHFDESLRTAPRWLHCTAWHCCTAKSSPVEGNGAASSGTTLPCNKGGSTFGPSRKADLLCYRIGDTHFLARVDSSPCCAYTSCSSPPTPTTTPSAAGWPGAEQC